MKRKGRSKPLDLATLAKRRKAGIHTRLHPNVHEINLRRKWKVLLSRIRYYCFQDENYASDLVTRTIQEIYQYRQIQQKNKENIFLRTDTISLTLRELNNLKKKIDSRRMQREKEYTFDTEPEEECKQSTPSTKKRTPFLASFSSSRATSGKHSTNSSTNKTKSKRQSLGGTTFFASAERAYKKKIKINKRSKSLPHLVSPFLILGVPRNSDLFTCKKAYRKKVLEVHPDKINGKEEDFHKLQKAWAHVKSILEQ